MDLLLAPRYNLLFLICQGIFELLRIVLKLILDQRLLDDLVRVIVEVCLLFVACADVLELYAEDVLQVCANVLHDMDGLLGLHCFLKVHSFDCVFFYFADLVQFCDDQPIVHQLVLKPGALWPVDRERIALDVKPLGIWHQERSHDWLSEAVEGEKTCLLEDV